MSPLTRLRCWGIDARRRACLEALRDHVLAHGRPLAVYSDRHGIFRVNTKDAKMMLDGDGKTEFGRVAARLDIDARLDALVLAEKASPTFASLGCG